MPKKKWETPKLVVLVRGRREEAVLQACKGDVGGAIGAFFECSDAGVVFCDICSETTSS